MTSLTPTMPGSFPEYFGPCLSGRVDAEESRPVLFLSGELDAATASAVKDRLMELVATTDGPVVLDLTELGFLGSTGIATMLAVDARLRESGRGLAVRGASGPVRRVLDLTDVYEHFGQG